MRLVHLADYGGPYAGSFVPMLLAVARTARTRGWECELVFSQQARGRHWLSELDSAGAVVRFLPPRRGVAALLAERPGPTILHTHFTRFDVVAALARLQRQEARVFWHFHTRMRDAPAVVARNVVKFVLLGPLVERILCVGEGIAASARRRGAPPEKVLRFPNAIDTGRFAPRGNACRQEARAALGLSPDARVLLHFGWDWHTKGGDLFLNAVERLLTGGSDNLLALTVGSGDEARSLASRLGIADFVRVEPPAERVGDLYAAADILVASSRAEGMPYAVAEAVSSGLPVVATDIPGHSSLAAAPSVRIAAAEPDALAEAVLDALNRDVGEAQAGRRWAVENLDLGTWAERLFRLYDQAPAR
jgi:glycosyltransferase involved in cell wall biosynthesis